VIESKTEDGAQAAEEYVQRVSAFLKQVRGWCEEYDLVMKEGVTTLREEDMPDYDAPSLAISVEGVNVATIVPVGSKILCAQGRVDIKGLLTRHSLLFRLGAGPRYPYLTRADFGQKVPRRLMRPNRAVEQDGWYWIEGHIRKPKLVDKSLFLDLLTDVSDYEFF